jgi:hypothetical protein
MPRSVYFSQAVKSEQNLYEDLIIESLGIYGQDVYYIPRTLVNRDAILGEDPASKFDDAYLLEMYIENTEGFEGSGDLYAKFGLEVRDDATFIVSRRRWETRVGVFSDNSVDPRPQEGDLIFLPMTNSFFEISYVEDDSPFYQLSNLPVYKMQCTLFEYNDEDFETGITGIDEATAKSAYQLPMDVTITSGNHFEVGEVIEQLVSFDTTAVNKAVTVTSGAFYLDASIYPALTLPIGSVVTFDQSASSNTGHPFKLSTTANGSHASGSEYTTGVVISGTPGSAGAKTVITVSATTPTLYYYCPNHSGMGSTAALTPAYISPVKVFGEVQQRTKSSDTSSKLWISNIGASGTTTAKDFTVGGTVTGLTSTYTGTIATIYSDLTDTTGQAWAADEAAQNIDFELDADGFIDFSESNPFGDPSETY